MQHFLTVEEVIRKDDRATSHPCQSCFSSALWAKASRTSQCNSLHFLYGHTIVRPWFLWGGRFSSNHKNTRNQYKSK